MPEVKKAIVVTKRVQRKKVQLNKNSSIVKQKESMKLMVMIWVKRTNGARHNNISVNYKGLKLTITYTNKQSEIMHHRRAAY